MSDREQLTKLAASRADLSTVYRLAYVSETSPHFEPGDLKEIKETSIIRNAELDVTGILSIDDGKILQILEGEQRVVTDLFAKIAEDPRHQFVQKVAGAEQESRYLSCWSMVSGQVSTAPAGLKEDLHRLHARLTSQESLEDVTVNDVELLKVKALFRLVPV